MKRNYFVTSQAVMMPRLLVLFQFSGIFLVLISGRILPLNFFSYMVSAFGIFLGLWAIVEQGLGNFNVTPTNKTGSELINTGPYRLIRHPMYLAILLALFPFMIEHFNYYRLAAGIFLLCTLIAKLEYEEKQLLKHFKDYQNYRKKTKKLIPFLY